MNPISDDLLELQARVDQQWANRKYKRETISVELRDAALEKSRQYLPSLLRRVLSVNPWRLAPKAKTNARRSRRQSAQTAFFKSAPITRTPAESLTTQTSIAYRLQLECPDGSRLTLTLSSFAPRLKRSVRRFPSRFTQVSQDRAKHGLQLSPSFIREVAQKVGRIATEKAPA